MGKSAKEIEIEKSISNKLKGKVALAASLIFNDEEVQALQDYANIVSIKRLGYNDHGPVHMRTAAFNSIIMFDLLHDAGIKFNLEKEKIGGVDDSKVAVLISSLLHDTGMSVTRDNHEVLGVVLAIPIIDRILGKVYPNDIKKRIIIRSLIIEGIAGHMANHSIHSLEAGLVSIGDGCDMAKGRARIPFLLSQAPHVGDIHKYSANSIQKVEIIKGEEKPIRIIVEMTESVGFFQIEEVLFPKIILNPVKPYIELYGRVSGKDLRRYL
ncbi:MAG: phosphohydrolase [Candidatus Caldatribacteriota bacterium]|nr:phosphohydrolase [Candidatus Caldatribacteriota bacterium]